MLLVTSTACSLRGAKLCLARCARCRPTEHVAAGGDPWDTVKPLAKWFRRLHRVLLVDDDAFKALPGGAAPTGSAFGGTMACMHARTTHRQPHTVHDKQSR